MKLLHFEELINRHGVRFFLGLFGIMVLVSVTNDHGLCVMSLPLKRGGSEVGESYPLGECGSPPSPVPLTCGYRG